MNVKKTIASIAAIAMVASATSLAPLFTGTSIAAEESGTVEATTPETETDPEANPETAPEETDETNAPAEEVDPYGDETEIEQTPAVQAVTEVTTSGYSGGTITAAMGTVGNTTHVSVKIPDGIAGSLEPNVDNDDPLSNIPGRGVYCIRIPVTGLDSTWDFGDGTHYEADNKDKNNNIKSGELLLWLDTTVRATYTINLTNGTNTKTIYITQEGNVTTPTLGAMVDDAAVDADKVTTTTESGATVVSVTLPEGAIGKPEDGTGNKNPSNKDYYLVIPVQGIDPSWTFKSGWDYDQKSHHEWNISTGALKLWVPVGTDTTHTIVLTNGPQEKTIIIKTNPAEVSVPVTVGTTATVRNDTVINGTGSAEVTPASGATPATVTVTLTPSGETPVTGLPQEGSDAPSAPKNYHITIPVTGLTTEWTFKSGYGFDSGVHTDNIDTGELKLWLPVTNKEHTIVLTKGAAVDAETLTIKVKTIVRDPIVDEEPEEPTDAEKVAAVKAELAPEIAAAKDSWNFEGKTHEEAEAIVRAWFASKGYEFAGNIEIVFDWQEANNGVWIGFNITFGNEHEYTVGAWKNYTAPVVVVPSEPAPSGPVYYYPSVSYNPVNSSAGTVQTVSTSAQISAYKQKEVTIDASKTDVTPAMVKAFIKNKNIKTLTLKYSSSLKISIDKANITDASANFDFSVSGKNFLSAKQLKKIKGEKIVQLDFVNKGKLDGVEKAAVKVRVGANYIGKTVTIYEYKDGKLVKVGKAKVNGAGIVKFNTNRLSQFVLAVE